MSESGSGSGSRRGDMKGSEVVEPACAELLSRLRRARALQGGGPGRVPSGPREDVLGSADRAVFAMSVEKRRRVVETSLAIVLFQWTFYRIAVRNTPRPLRIAYGTVATFGTLQFASRRAASVTHDMFTSIVNLPEDSSLGNEARIILADLEGPDGPFYTSAVKEDLRKSIYERAMMQASADATDVHPQLCLEPRLLRTGTEQAHPPIHMPPKGVPAPAGPPRTVVRPRKADEDGAALPPLEPLPALPSEDNDYPPLPRPDPNGLNTPGVFDFAAAARGERSMTQPRETQFHEDVEADKNGDEASKRAADMTPAERRAAERASRRQRARMRSETSHDRGKS